MSSSLESDDEGPAMRARYTMEEDNKILQYVISQNLCSRVKGKAMWVGMEIALRTKDYGRTWLSLKERYSKHIVHHIHNYNIDPKIIRHILEPYNKPEMVEGPTKKVIKTGRRKYYSYSEDKKLIEAVCKMKENICGNKLWKIIEERNILEGRTWSSLRNRFLAHIIDNLDSLTDPETAELIRRRMSGEVCAETVKESGSGEQQQVRKQSPTKKQKRPLLPSGFEELSKSPLRRDTSQGLEARLNRIRRNDPEPQPGPSSQSKSYSASRAPSHYRRKDTTASSGKRPTRRPSSEWLGSSFKPMAVTATSTPIGAGRAQTFSHSEASSPPRKNLGSPANAIKVRKNLGSPANAIKVADRVPDPLPGDDSAVVGGDSLGVIAFNLDSSTEELSDDDVETFIDPLYAEFVDDKTYTPFVVVLNGAKMKLSDLKFPMVDVF